MAAVKTGYLIIAGIIWLVVPLSATLASTLNVDDDNSEIEHIVVTTVAMQDPLIVVTDPKKPRQPLPAHDGADYLRSITGFSAIRKGGASSDPLFRGMAGSRLNILTDGDMLLGGCGSRMDPPTAYIAPQAYDKLTIIKGPQTVIYGPGSSAATVLFERDNARLTQPGVSGSVNTTGASAGRFDSALDVTGGNSSGFARAIATVARSDDYRDGSGQRIHSAYQRWSSQLELGYTPSDDNTLLLKFGRSDGEAAYADRLMDGSVFKRQNLGLKWSLSALNRYLQRLDVQWYYNYIDHVMDNFSLRTFTPGMMMANPSASNPDRRTLGGRLFTEWQLHQDISWQLGLDAARNIHRIRNSMNQQMMPYQQQPRQQDIRFTQLGLFSELEYQLNDSGQLIAGARLDYWQATDSRPLLGSMAQQQPNPSFGQQRDDYLKAGFIRYQQQLANWQWYLGLGYNERFPDYWELAGAGRAAEQSISAFYIKPELTTQLDLGLIYQHRAWQLGLSLFANTIDDYLLSQQNWPLGMQRLTVSRNIDARSVGAELDLSYRFNNQWHSSLALAYVRGKNYTDNLPLAQQPPLEAKLAVNYDQQNWYSGVLWRLVAAQHRVAPGQGNIVGTDIAPSPGFGVLSWHAGWRYSSTFTLVAGIDNLTDQQYHEHLSKAGAMVSGFLPVAQINEAGRTLWLNMNWQF
ncbi:iron complex outermembrane recepter protein [Arsukibacterium tuosuense]|uniref:Iron complex outermembrane recepter protein n=1 Tax=Arsukibacterium tuosuense TaxID=1323745 RepID=A0A285JEV6_9GAMM|nr:TonB-dependent copper receptor [Arsukibacterium tuosuense]SNY58798.1 iron complex outermembrane recepter protein [Arsukibacterium tuosuense]